MSTELDATLQPLLSGDLPDAARLHAWRGAIEALGMGADATLARTWRQVRPVVRSQALRPLLEGLRIGPLLVAELLDAVEAAEPDSANAALHVLGEADVDLDAAAWRRIGRVARRERGQLLPDREAAALLARQGPRAALATVVLTATRPGPEDADDRLQALAALGRFDDARVPDLVARLVATGTGTLEALQTSALALAQGADGQAWRGVLEAALRLRDTDAWARWSALDGLSRLDPDAALPWLVAAFRAGGQDLPPWYLQFCAQRARALGAEPSVFTGDVPTMAPLPDLRGRVASRCARIARAAMVEWQARGGDEAVVRARAAVEQALVRRGQLLASFVADARTVPAELGVEWTPNASVVGEPEMRAWQSEETAWLA